jgi:nitrogen fixation NifU-like protein
MERTGPYNETVMKHFRKPHNYGKMKNPSGIGKVGNTVCGDVMWLYIKVAKDKKGREILKEIKFETFGCVAALATSSVVTDLAKGKTIEEAMKISREDVVKSLGGLPPVKLHCSVLAADALNEAIYDYLEKGKRPIPEGLRKIHERVWQDRHSIEKRYKKWVDTEEKMHEAEHG